MHAQNCLFLALKCSIHAHSDLDKHMEALFFIHGGGLAYKSPFAAPRQLRHPHWQEAWECSSAGRAPFSPVAGAGAAGACGGAGGAGAALLNSSPLLMAS